MKNPVPTSKLFVTPKDEQDLFNRIEQLVGPDKALAYQVAMMTFNLAHKLVKEQMSETVDA